jgi:hypothetical protein
MAPIILSKLESTDDFIARTQAFIDRMSDRYDAQGRVRGIRELLSVEAPARRYAAAA